MGNIRSFKELRVWQTSMDAAMEIFELTKVFPVEERFSLTDQMRRSSRSVAANVTEAWRKRRYPAAFVSKLSDAESEAAETQTWLEISRRCGYLSDQEAQQLDQKYEEILAQLVTMISHPEKWVLTGKQGAGDTESRDAGNRGRGDAESRDAGNRGRGDTGTRKIQ